MLLTRLSSYLQLNRRAALTDMAIALNAAPEALRDMLTLLERKQRVTKLPAGSSCGGGCNKCAPDSIEIYQWVSGQH